MSEIDNLVAAQAEDHCRIRRFFSNLQKLPIPRRTVQTVESRIDRLQEIWRSCKDRHEQVFELSDASIRAALPYFLKGFFAEMEDSYEEVLDALLIARAEWGTQHPQTEAAQSKATAGSSQLIGASGRGAHDDLQPIRIKPFSGGVLDWVAFRDLFLAVVDSRTDLSDCQKLHHLKAAAEGDAARLLDSYTITDAHYKEAWEALVARYEAPVPILRAYLDSFFAIPKVGRARKNDIKVIRDEADAIYRKLKALGRAENMGEDMFVHFVLSRLDDDTLEAWEATREDDRAFPSFEELDKFLTRQVRILRPSVSSSKSSASRVPVKPPKPHNFVALQTTPVLRSCIVCAEDHPLFQCALFQSYPLSQRYAILNAHKRCVNCFRIGHTAKDCNSKNTCKHWETSGLGAMECGRRVKGAERKV